ncbi:hypothetical protein [Virgibacillus senegalensis]|uniref:hypothetical protein n=1 Tax=Virgibacillus senegalensis TaxID=1499679 RepID=UPI000AB6B186|nr:hypothetical protein [Virgibacillus senegalensis]
MEKRSIGLYEGIAFYFAAVLGSGVLFISSVTALYLASKKCMKWQTKLYAATANLPISY